ncbi:DUF4435 domain-containing protein [Desulfobacterales bacterium HSG16]|nr:DUF4435 domain-containing protein [Desulfobacterales bacterium HSG16]
MTVFSQSIGGGRFSFIDNQDIRNDIDIAGRKKVVFIEGYDDKVIFEILFHEELEEVAFIDTSAVGQSGGGCDKVKEYLEKTYRHLNETRFFGIIDRDFKTDHELDTELNEPKYKNKLYIFRDRYTLENYFIEKGILLEYIRGKSSSNKKLKGILGIDISGIINNILMKLIIVAAGNRTLLDYRNKFLNRSTPCDKKIVVTKILSKLLIKEYEVEKRTAVKRWYDYYRKYMEKDSFYIHKHISGKYFFYHFNKAIKDETNRTCGKQINIDIDNAKDNLARILKIRGLPDDLNNILVFLGVSDVPDHNN